MFRSFFSRVFSWFTPIAKNIINWRITSQKAAVERGIHIRENATDESEGLHYRLNSNKGTKSDMGWNSTKMVLDLVWLI
jgi:hypothetical protein